jgi:hypothetical protein
MDCKAELKTKNFYGRISRCLFLNVFADEAKPDENSNKDEGDKTPPAPVVINYEDLIAKARKEEKEKLYGKIKQYETEIGELTKKNNENILLVAQKDEEIKKLTTQLGSKEESKELKDLRSENEKLKIELDKAKKETPKAEEISKKVREEVEAEYEVKLYRTEKIHSASGKIIPELVTGTTKEEIDQTFDIAKKRFEDIVKTNTQSNMPPVSSTSSNVNTKKYTLDDLRSVDPRSPEYAKIRKELGLR